MTNAHVRLGIIGALLASSSMFSVGAHAQQQAEGDEAATSRAELEEIVVQARRRDEGLQDVPISVAVISERDLENFDLGLASELQNYVPNLTINGAFGSTNPQIFIRGVGNNDYNDNAGATVGVYLDGVFVNAPAGKLLQVFDTENVQVLRGPQGTLFGRNNTAGAILFSPKKPGDKFEGQISTNFGNFGQRDVEAALTVPLGSTLSTRIAVNSRNSTGWGENRDSNDNFVKKIGGVEQFAGRMITVWQPSDATRVELNLSYAETDDKRLPGRQRGGNPNGADNLGWINPSDNIRVNYSNYEEIERVNTTGAFLNIEHEFDALTLTSVSAYWDSERFVTLDVDKSAFSTLHLSRNPKAKQYSQEIRLSSPKGSSVNWVVGAQAFKEDLTSVNLWSFLGDRDPADANTPQVYTNESKAYAAFAEADFNLNDTFSLTIGGRYTIDERDFAMDFPFVGINSQVRSRRDTEFSGRIILKQKIGENASTYYSISRGFQGGGYNGGAFAVVDIGNGYGPETLTAYEIGFKGEFLDRRLRVNAAGFYYDYNDIQIFSLAADGQGGFSQFITNADGGKLLGFEAEVQLLVTPEFRIGAGLGLLDSKYQDSNLSLFGQGGQAFPGDGNSFVSAPKVDLNVFADYTINISGFAIDIHADYAYQSKRFFDVTSRPDVGGNGYGLLNGRIAIKPFDADLSIAFWAKNILDEEYVSFVADLSGFAGFYETFYGAPRQYGVQLAVKF